MNKHILIVEDTKDLLANVQELLVMESYEVWTANNGKEGLQVLDKIIPHLIITDLLMPILDGFEFIRCVRTIPSLTHVPILVFSAMPPEENEVKVLKLGANYYLKKPSTLEALLEAVTKLIIHER